MCSTWTPHAVGQEQRAAALDTPHERHNPNLKDGMGVEVGGAFQSATCLVVELANGSAEGWDVVLAASSAVPFRRVGIQEVLNQGGLADTVRRGRRHCEGDDQMSVTAVGEPTTSFQTSAIEAIGVCFAYPRSPQRSRAEELQCEHSRRRDYCNCRWRRQVYSNVTAQAILRPDEWREDLRTPADKKQRGQLLASAEQLGKRGPDSSFSEIAHLDRARFARLTGGLRAARQCDRGKRKARRVCGDPERCLSRHGDGSEANWPRRAARRRRRGRHHGQPRGWVRRRAFSLPLHLSSSAVIDSGNFEDNELQKQKRAGLMDIARFFNPEWKYGAAGNGRLGLSRLCCTSVFAGCQCRYCVDYSQVLRVHRDRRPLLTGIRTLMISFVLGSSVLTRSVLALMTAAVLTELIHLTHEALLRPSARPSAPRRRPYVADKIGVLNLKSWLVLMQPQSRQQCLLVVRTRTARMSYNARFCSNVMDQAALNTQSCKQPEFFVVLWTLI